jgi:hypothetical protein
MSEEKQNLIKQQQAGDALRELRSHHGWQELVRLFQEQYTANVRLLIEKGNPDTRMRLQVIEEIVEQMDLKIQLAKVAADELKTEKFKDLQATP